MSNYETVAKEIVDSVGGLENIVSVQYCMTRLRLALKERSLVEDEKLKQVPMVKGINDSAGQLQIILGTGIVNKVYKEVDKLCQTEGKENVELKSGNSLQRISRIFGDIFLPIIPVIIASGLLMGVRSYFTSAGILGTKSSWYIIFSVLIDTGFTFLPVLVAWSATKKFGGSPALGIVMGLMLISSSLPAANAVGKGTAQPLIVSLLGIKFSVKAYTSSILVPMVAAWILSFTEDRLRRIIPNVIDMILTPILTLAITFFICIFGIGPVANLLETIIVGIYQFVLTLPLGIGGFITAGLQQPLVITGMHHATWIIDINFLAKTGKNLFQPIRNASVLGQGGACLAFALFAKNAKVKSNSIASTVAAFFGITEPAIFGTTLIYGKPFLFGCLGSALGGMFSTAVGLAAKGMGTAAIPGILYYIGSTDLYLYLIQSVITVIVPLVLTSIYIKKKDI